MKKTIFAVLVMLGLIAGLRAEEKLKWKRVEAADDGFMLIKRGYATSNLIPVDVDVEYVFSGEFLRKDSIGPNLYFCLIPYDKNKKQIEVWNVGNVPGSETTLAKACKAGDTTLTIKDAGAKWKTAFNATRRKPYVAFDVDNEGTFTDLPNSNLIKMEKLDNADGIWTIKLKTPCKKDYPAGAPLRLHVGVGGMMMLALLPEKKFPIDEVKKITVTVSGERLSGVGKNNKDEVFWKGTKYVQFYILVLKNQLLFKNISVKETD